MQGILLPAAAAALQHQDTARVSRQQAQSPLLQPGGEGGIPAAHPDPAIDQKTMGGLRPGEVVEESRAMKPPQQRITSPLSSRTRPSGPACAPSPSPRPTVRIHAGCMGNPHKGPTFCFVYQTRAGKMNGLVCHGGPTVPRPDP